MSTTVVVYNESWGLGDALLLTPGLHALRHSGKYSMIGCVTRHACLLAHNPDIDTLYDAETYPAGAHDHLFRDDVTIVYVGYHRHRRSLFGAHVLDVIANILNVPHGDHRLYFYVRQEEAMWASALLQRIRRDDPERPIVLMQVGTSYTPNKFWPVSYWMQLVRLVPRATFVQVGVPGEPAIPGAISLLGQTDPRQVIALAKLSAATVSVDSFLGHASAAAGTPGVVLFGPTSPMAFGHASNVNLTSAMLACMPCFRPAQLELDTMPDPRDHTHQIPWVCSHRSCMNHLLPEVVAGALHSLLGLAAE